MRKERAETVPSEVPSCVAESPPLWQLDIVELTGHNLEARGREDVNRLLQEGWHLLHIYTLRYQEDSVCHERPMAILGRSRGRQQQEVAGSKDSAPRRRLRIATPKGDRRVSGVLFSA